MQLITKEKILQFSSDDVTKYFNYNIDWTKEPPESLKELMKQQAQLIRDTYKYIILYFSGGSDSTTMLNAFLDNNIHVDEVVTIIYENVNLPCFDGVLANNYLKSKNYTGLYNLVTIKFDDICKFIRSDNCLCDWTQKTTGAIHTLSRLNIEELEKNSFTKYRIRPTNIAHVYGVDNPKIVKKENCYYVAHNLLPEWTTDHSNVRFFKNFSFPKLYLKQAHLLAKEMKKNNLDTMTTEFASKIIRDTYNPIISPLKSNVTTLVKFPEKKTELNMLVNYYETKTNLFKDSYFNSVVLYQAMKHEIFIHKCMMNIKYDLLF